MRTKFGQESDRAASHGLAGREKEGRFWQYHQQQQQENKMISARLEDEWIDR